MELGAGSGRETLGSSWELSQPPGALDLLYESTQQDKVVSKHWFAPARICSATNGQYFMTLHKTTVSWGFLSIMYVGSKKIVFEEKFFTAQ